MSEKIHCFMLEETGQLQRQLRRFGRQQSQCSGGRRYHDASSSVIDCVPAAEHNEAEFLACFPCGEPPWPERCRCGYLFIASDGWDVAAHSAFRRTDNGQIITLRDAPPGAMWWLSWWDDYYNPQLGKHPLCVMTPGGEWVIDSQASNCTMKDDSNQDQHHCWIAHGVPPDVTVDKAGRTCAAGAGSIQCGSYHGYLRNGYLVRS